MKKTILLAVCLLFTFYLVQGQQLSLSGQVGYAIGETKNWKKFMLLTGGSAGIEWELNRMKALKIGIGTGMLSFSSKNDTGVSVFTKKSMLVLPVSIIKKYTITRTTIAYMEFGINNSLYFREKRETFSPSGKITEKLNSTIFNVGGLVGVGLLTPISSRWNFGVAIGGHFDVFSFYKKAGEKFKSSSNIINTSFSRKL
ncbi:MAG: hypothetical protein H7Y86_11540 [Rhizobacter sp.]|nr:hypothetical protein [Ferruginibacter sp.]